MRRLIAAAALLAAPLAANAAAPNDIIWDPPKAAAPKTAEVSKETMTPLGQPAAEGRQNSQSNGQPDKNGIIWDTPASQSSSQPAAKAGANGITWNAPPVKPSSRKKLRATTLKVRHRPTRLATWLAMP